MPVEAALLDVDGTLIDSNYQHALAWYRAFRQQGIVLPVWRIHRAIGMGGVISLDKIPEQPAFQILKGFCTIVRRRLQRNRTVRAGRLPGAPGRGRKRR